MRLQHSWLMRKRVVWVTKRVFPQVSITGYPCFSLLISFSRPTRARSSMVRKSGHYGLLGWSVVERRFCYMDVLVLYQRILPRVEYLARLHYEWPSKSVKVISKSSLKSSIGSEQSLSLSSLDCLRSSHPVEVPIQNPNEINQVLLFQATPS